MIYTVRYKNLCVSDVYEYFIENLRQDFAKQHDLDDFKAINGFSYSKKVITKGNLETTAIVTLEHLEPNKQYIVSYKHVEEDKKYTMYEFHQDGKDCVIYFGTSNNLKDLTVKGSKISKVSWYQKIQFFILGKQIRRKIEHAKNNGKNR